MVSSFKHWNSGPIFINISIFTLSFMQTLEFCCYRYTHWNCYLILLNVGIVALFYINIGILALFLQTLEFFSNPSIANIEILPLSFQTIELKPIIYTHWFCVVMLQNIGILALFLYALELKYDASKEWNSNLILMCWSSGLLEV